MALYMAAPRTYTREDVVEFSCHGSPAVLRRALAVVLNCGARLAGPGEFTLRAFLNGRIDLAQAEAVLDVITAQSEAGLRVALSGLEGRLSKEVRSVSAALMRVQAYLVACIDFPEDEVEAQLDIDPSSELHQARTGISQLLASADAGIAYRLGLRTAIAGRPNVGKSSLLNRLLGAERAIVTDIPGTTRDTVEEVAVVRGIPFHLIDTAGIQDTADVVEGMGIERSRRAIEQADLVLLVVDGNAPLNAQDTAVLGLAAGRPAITVVNKADLPQRLPVDGVPSPVVAVSARTGQGMDALYELMAAAALGERALSSDAAVLVASPRHKAALQKAAEHVDAAAVSLAASMPSDFVTIDLAAALTALGEITGENASEELLERIFREFCIGK
jgi:tRNA modification GTPase